MNINDHVERTIDVLGKLQECFKNLEKNAIEVAAYPKLVQQEILLLRDELENLRQR